ncbi:MAG: hypothetical protein P8K66_11065 [Planctomycetota bacterium]|nr:hypothetical protein [Planctomycetota bacterium]
MNLEPNENFEMDAEDTGEIDSKSAALNQLQERFGNRDGVSMIPERLGPQEIQWLGLWFMSTGPSGSGCGGGAVLELLAPIFDSKLDLWGRKHMATAPSRRCAIEAFSASLFVHGLHAGLSLREEDVEEVTFEDLVDLLRHYNHADSSEGTMEQIDPAGFSSTWPLRWLDRMQKLYPSLMLTLNALKRISVSSEPPDEGPTLPFLLTPPSESTTMPIGLRIFFFAGAIAAGVTPGISTMPFPIGCESAQEMTQELECEKESVNN